MRVLKTSLHCLFWQQDIDIKARMLYGWLNVKQQQDNMDGMERRFLFEAKMVLRNTTRSGSGWAIILINQHVEDVIV
ncbi:hypothetical protein O0I10_003962 [Lichtheimia ornata]|uniref:Uncharacterized protein n=1 Tax=Lichtheimia ornata TaxID=688661 RepID=A0AAD7V7M6_9FUNG|nr:uncharacterized protein O0I10_003962 [Lichtheimia ornata]KAJ8660103.1 hypothetical protein O0I10_003962 [Lichtheimia ornata]